MRGDMAVREKMRSQTGSVYVNQVARAIVRMDDKLSNFFMPCVLPNTTFAIDRSIAIDVLGTPALDQHHTGLKQVKNGCIGHPCTRSASHWVGGGEE